MHSDFRRDFLVTCLFLFFSLIAVAEVAGAKRMVKESIFMPDPK